MRGVIPCLPEEVDASAANMTHSLPLRDDVRMTSITVENGVPTQLSYNWAYDSTVSLEASFDLIT